MSRRAIRNWSTHSSSSALGFHFNVLLLSLSGVLDSLRGFLGDVLIDHAVFFTALGQQHLGKPIAGPDSFFFLEQFD